MGMGGMPGMGGMGGMGRGGASAAAKKPKKSEPTVHHLSLSLEDLYTGLTKKMKITRKRLVDGKYEPQSKVVEIQVKPGWKEGTKITFEGEGTPLLLLLPSSLPVLYSLVYHPLIAHHSCAVQAMRARAFWQVMWCSKSTSRSTRVSCAVATI